MTAGYLGWIAYALSTVIDLHVLNGQSKVERTFVSTSVFVSILVGLFSIFIYQRSSWRYYIYGFFPVFFWEEVFAQRKSLMAGIRVLLQHVRSPKEYATLAAQTVVFLGVLEALVSEDAFFFFHVQSTRKLEF